MSAISFARQAFSREKPHSSTTDWIDILTSSNYSDEDHDGIPELVDSINLQPTGPAEASRAIRKKIKHGDPHQQYRAIVILHALVANGGHKFQTTFADGHLTDALKTLATESATNPKVKKKLLLVLLSWQNQFKSDPSMTLVAGLYKQCRHQSAHPKDKEAMDLWVPPPPQGDDERQKKEEKKRKEKEQREEEKRRQKSHNKPKTRRQPFDFEKEKPQVLTSVANATQAANNLVNAITLVNPESGSLIANERVQECLLKAKQSRKSIVRYIQLVENEELIGTLIETNERIIAAMGMYDKMSNPSPPSAEDITSGLAAANISLPESEVNKLQERQRIAVERVKARQNSISDERRDENGHIHPDLQDLSFGPLGDEKRNLPPPLRPTSSSAHPDADEDSDPWQYRGSLSDFSDYESSDEESHMKRVAPGLWNRRDRVSVSDDEDEAPRKGKGKLVNPVQDDDPFADPFAD